MRARYWLLALSCLFIVSSFAAAAGEKGGQLSPALPYQAQRSDPVTHEVDFSVVVTPPYHCKTLKVWLPIPQSDFAQQVLGASDFSTFPQQVTPKVGTESVFGNKFAYFEFDHPEGAQIIRHKFKVKVWNLHWDLNAKKVQVVKDWPESFAPFLKLPALKQQDEFGKLVKTFSPAEPGQGLFRAMDWIEKNLKYTHVNASLKADPDFALAHMGGHCSDYHGLCTTLGRALGYPTRMTYGITLIPKNSPSHCRMEAYLPPYGWVSFDLSETQQLVKKIHEDKKLDATMKEALTKAARDRLAGGFRENCWLLLTKGANYQLEPKAVAPVPVVRTAYVEADGEILPDPDPANSKQRQFAWMTVHHYTADRPFPLPFKDYSTLKPANK